MDTQLDYAAGMPIGMLDELPPAVDAAESLFTAQQELLAPEHPNRISTDHNHSHGSLT